MTRPQKFSHLLEIKNLKKSYGKKQVVKGISFSVRSGEIIGLLGPNGAGKTTTFYMVVGFLKAQGGQIRIDGEDITKLQMYQRSQRGISYLPQEPSIFRKLTVEDNLRLVIQTRTDLSKAEKKEAEERLLENFGLQDLRKQYGDTLSGGERRRTEIARALAINPHFLLLDEPFAGIDPKAVSDIKRIVRQLSQRGIGILLTDHNVRDALAITTCSHIINEGTILVSGGKEELLADEVARDIYFGTAFEED
ncbi:MAG: LPS export ABC transporter ATP-binding protein [Spirochaetia bacterium]|jgi:lipopolysaccharide export system ATP-binding protein|nr:LPS export ABC transporter ATP-binding protein [Spirochaetia bacterium]